MPSHHLAQINIGRILAPMNALCKHEMHTI